MTHLVFYEKPGCGGNARQRAAEPLLIRRPLMQSAVDGSRHVGFDTAAVTAWIGLQPSTQQPSPLEGCNSPTTSCSHPIGGHHAAV